MSDVAHSVAEANYRGSTLDHALIEEYDSAFGRLKQLHETVRSFDGEKSRIFNQIRAAAKKVLSANYAKALAEHTIDELGEYPLDVAPSSLRAMHAAKLNTLLDLSPYKSEWSFTSIRGIGEVKSREIFAAYQRLRTQVRGETRLTFSGELNDNQIELLRQLRLLQTLLVAERSLNKFVAEKDAAVRIPQSTFGIAEPLRTNFGWLLPNRKSKVAARENVARMLSTSASIPTARAQDAFNTYFTATAAQQQATGEQVVRDFNAEPAAYYALLSKFIAPSAGSVGEDGAAATSHEGSELSEPLWTMINNTQLDLDGFTAILRPYQEFGVKFLVHQKRTILGDDPGLGKTLMGLAYMTHVTNVLESKHGKRPTHLVIGPLSLQLNWAKEIAKHSTLNSYLMQTKKDEIPAGTDIVISTYERASDLLKSKIGGAVIVDEAHFIKNADTGRTQRVRALIENKRDVTFMSGTALENRLEEMTNLMNYVNQEVGEKLIHLGNWATPETYRAALAEGYLRRNKEDVLTELPDLVEKQETVAMSTLERQRYTTILDESSHPWHALRQLGYQSPEHGKAQRVVEIIEEAVERGEKVLLFSYYLSTLTQLQKMFAHVPQIRVDGEVSADQRQPLIDKFNEHDGAMLYFSQINTGGVGLNLQSASRVIILEPQVKPSLTTQAIARAHRMGQLNTVFVHTMITQDAIDEAMYEVEQAKQEVFDTYVRNSDLGKRSAEEEITAGEIKKILAAQRAKYGVTA